MKLKIICQYNIVKRDILERKTTKTTKFEIFFNKSHFVSKSNETNCLSGG